MKTSDEIGILVTGSLTSFVGRIAGKGAHFLLELVAARLLGAESFGEYVVAWTLLRMLGTMSHLGVDQIGMRTLAGDSAPATSSQGQLIGQCVLTPLVFGTLLVAVIWTLTDHLAPILFDSTELAQDLLLVAAAGAPLLGACMVGSALTRATQSTRYSVLAYDLLQPVSHLLYSLIAFFAISVTALNVLAAGLASLTTSLALLSWFLIRLYPVAPSMPFTPGTSYLGLLKESLPILLVAVASLLMMWTDILLLATLGNAEAVGQYRVAAQLAFALTMILPAMNEIVGPQVAKLFAAGEYQRLREIYILSSKWPLYIVAPVTLALPFVGTDLLVTLFGRPYAAASLPFLLLAFGQLVNALSGSPGQLLTMSANQGTWSRILGLSATLNLLLNYLFIPTYAAIGAAVATLISIIAMFSCGLAAAYKHANILPFDRRHWKVLRSSLGTLGLLFLVDSPLSSLPPMASLTLHISFAYGSFFFLHWIQHFDSEDALLLHYARANLPFN